MNLKKKIAVFIDRDGTISNEVGYVNHISRFGLIPGIAAAINLLNQNGILTIVLTNQAGVARGYFPEYLVGEVHEKMRSLLREGGAEVDGVYYCPHHPDVGEGDYRKNCECRKPKTGMIKKAALEHNIDLSRSYMVGDKISDVEMGQRVGSKGILVETGYGLGELTYDQDKWKVKPDQISQDLYNAVFWILEDIKNISPNML